MVLTKAELIAALRNEVRIFLHLTTKIDRARLDYRPTPKQRSTLELVRYLTFMGPELLRAGVTGTFDTDAWNAAEQAAGALTYEQAIALLKKQGDAYAASLDRLSDADLRAEVSPFGEPSSRGAFIVNNVLCGCAAYRTQLFLYLKACGREELSTWDLWAGVDAPPQA